MGSCDIVYSFPTLLEKQWAYAYWTWSFNSPSSHFIGIRVSIQGRPIFFPKQICYAHFPRQQLPFLCKRRGSEDWSQRLTFDRCRRRMCCSICATESSDMISSWPYIASSNHRHFFTYIHLINPCPPLLEKGLALSQAVTVPWIQQKLRR